MKKFILEILAIAVASVAVIALIDARRVFAQEENNNHTGKRWHYLYQYGKKNRNAIDILVLGNSHSYTGLLPEQLTEYTGRTCFILASQGNFVKDSYYMLEEALTVVKPKLLVLETYTIRDYDRRNPRPVDLNCQFQSFENRRNFWLKLKSTPSLFTVNDAPYAWSKTLRNHSYLFDNPKLVSYNLAHPKAPVYKDKNYLGRFIRFNSGLTEPTLERYRKDGAPVDGSDFAVGADARKSLQKIRKLCRKNGIKLMFLTIPMYHEHVSHPEVMEQNLAEVIGNAPWLFLQAPEYDDFFTPDCFEDTYNHNQHQSANGAMKSTWALARFISSSNL